MDVQPSHAPADVLAGRFELQRVLGTGGMATVWSALDQRLGRTVALKILRSDLSEDHSHRIEREARAAARIDDHRVVTVLDLDHTDEGIPFLVFEALSGATLADELRRSGALALPRAQRLASDLLGGLAAAHRCGVLHRDVKPANVLVDGDGFRITDFGIASVSDETATSGDLMGTLVYLAPERFDGAPATPQTDVFSAAAVLYEALTGVQPFRAPSSAESLGRLRSGTFAPLSPQVPDHLARAVTDGLAPDPAQRPADATEFARRVENATDAGTQALVVEQPTEPLEPTARIERPTHHAVPPVPPPAPRAPDRGVAMDLRDRFERLRQRPGVAWAMERARRPQTIFVALCAVLLILLFVAVASASDGGSATPDTPQEQLDQQLERIEEIGR